VRAVVSRLSSAGHLTVLIVCYMTGRKYFFGNTVNVTVKGHDTVARNPALLLIVVDAVSHNPVKFIPTLCLVCVTSVLRLQMPEPLNRSTAEMVRTFVHKLKLLGTLS
jgi:hypothetical protein